MIVRKPLILYYDNGQEAKRKSLEKAVLHLGISFVPVTGAHFLQTVGHLAKVKRFSRQKKYRLLKLLLRSQKTSSSCVISPRKNWICFWKP